MVQIDGRRLLVQQGLAVHVREGLAQHEWVLATAWSPILTQDPLLFLRVSTHKSTR